MIDARVFALVLTLEFFYLLIGMYIALASKDFNIIPRWRLLQGPRIHMLSLVFLWPDLLSVHWLYPKSK